MTKFCSSGLVSSLTLLPVCLGEDYICFLLCGNHAGILTTNACRKADVIPYKLCSSHISSSSTVPLRDMCYSSLITLRLSCLLFLLCGEFLVFSILTVAGLLPSKHEYEMRSSSIFAIKSQWLYLVRHPPHWTLYSGITGLGWLLHSGTFPTSH